jgi:hypothetical protein
MPLSFSQTESVPPTSKNGKPEAKPNKNIVRAAGRPKAAINEVLLVVFFVAPESALARLVMTALIGCADTLTIQPRIGDDCRKIFYFYP